MCDYTPKEVSKITKKLRNKKVVKTARIDKEICNYVEEYCKKNDITFSSLIDELLKQFYNGLKKR